MAEPPEPTAQSNMVSPKSADATLPNTATAYYGTHSGCNALPDGNELLSTNGGHLSPSLISSGTCESELI